MGEHPLGFIKRATYWGLMVVLSAGMAYVLGNLMFHAKPIVVKARQKENLPPPPIPKAAAPAPVFPPLKLQGLIFQGTLSSALINGQVLRVGEDIGGVRVVAIGRDEVTVTLDGQTKVLKLKNP